MSWVAVGGAAVTIIGGVIANKQANKGNKAAAAGQQAGIDEQRREYDQTRQDQLPWLQSGGWALDQQKAFLQGDMSGWNQSADYLGALQGQTQALDRSAAARGNLFSGGHQGDLADLGQRLATQYMGNYYNRLAGMSGTGQNTAQNLGQLGQGYASNIAQGYANMGQARQSSYNNNAQLIAGTFGQIGNVAGNYLARRNTNQGQWY